MSSSPFVAIALVVSGACALDPSSPGGARGLQLSLALSSDQVQRGQPDTVAVTITNSNRYAVALEAGGCPVLFYIRNAEGSTVVPSGGGWVCVAIITQLHFAPRESQTRQFVWDTNAVASGRYSVYGTFTATGVHLETEPAAVQVN